MSRYSSDDHYLDPASGVLKNRPGITDDLLQASIDSFKGNITKLTALIRDNLSTLEGDAPVL
jgi:hypothetical protein